MATSSSSSQVIVVLVAAVAAAFLLLSAPATASGEQTPVGYAASPPLTVVNGGQPLLRPLEDSKASKPCHITRPNSWTKPPSTDKPPYICYPKSDGPHTIWGIGCHVEQRVDCYTMPKRRSP